MVDVDEDGRLEEAAAALAAVAADEHAGALGERVRDVGLDDLELARRGDRTDVDAARAVAAPDSQRADLATIRSMSSSQIEASA